MIAAAVDPALGHTGIFTTGTKCAHRVERGRQSQTARFDADRKTAPRVEPEPRLQRFHRPAVTRRRTRLQVEFLDRGNTRWEKAGQRQNRRKC